MKIFISADIEGTAGITDWKEALKDGPGYAEYRAHMTAEVLAAIDGAREAGATEIVIKDAHETGRNLLVGELPTDVRIIRGWSGHPYSMMFGIDDSFDAALFTGYHSKAGSDANPLAHSFTGRIAKLWFNGQMASEFTLNALIAAHAGVPPVYLSGDRGMCADARAMVPAITTTAVSQGFGPATNSLTPAGARAAIKADVKAALSGNLASCRLTMPSENELVIEFANPVDAYRGSWYPGADQPAPCSLRFRHKDFFEVIRALRFFT